MSRAVFPAGSRDGTREVLQNRMQVFDGVVCFGGGDWWYHNHGHYDMQMMRRLSRQVPVLYVNSIGIRVPRIGEGKMFFRRMHRKLLSLRKGLVRVSKNFSVFSPVVVPGRLGMALSRLAFRRQVCAAARRVGMSSPLAWVTCPPASEILDRMAPVGIVYQRTDRWEAFPEADPQLIVSYDRRLKAQADLTLFCSTPLFDEESKDCRAAQFIDHGVDFDAFAAASDAVGNRPSDIKQAQGPRVGFIGGIDSHTFDADLFLAVARALPAMEFLLVGSCSFPDGWCDLPNVQLLGQRDYQAIPGYMAACDVLIMPWKRNEWIEACNPVKLKEYLAVGRPVVTTWFGELKRYEGYVRRADGPANFIEEIRKAVREECDARQLRRRVSDQTWEVKAKELVEHLRRLGLRPRASGTDSGR